MASSNLKLKGQSSDGDWVTLLNSQHLFFYDLNEILTLREKDCY